MTARRNNGDGGGRPGGMEEPPDEIVLDTALLRSAVRRRLGAWAIAVPAIVVAGFAFGAFIVPQTYTSEVTMSVQQSEGGGPTSALAALTGSGPSKKYIGVLQSRHSAEYVENRVHLKDLYNLPTERKAVDMLLKGAVHVQDNAGDGLLHVDVTLAGPPRLAPGGGAKGERARLAAANVANAYAAALHDYYVNSDNERDSVLLRGAETEERNARADFDSHVAELWAFVHRMQRADPQTIPSPAGDGSAAVGGTAASILALYTSLGQAEAQIRGASAALTTENDLVDKQLQSIPSVPTDDPLLAGPRLEVARARMDLQTLRVQLDDHNPRVVAARGRLQVAEDELQRQMEGVRNRETTFHVRSAAELARLKGQRDDLVRQIRTAVGKVRTRTGLTAESIALNRELDLSLNRLKTVEQEAAKLRLETVSAQSRVTVVDSAVPAEFGQPGFVRITAMGVGAALVMLIIWTTIGYVRDARLPAERAYAVRSEQAVHA